MINVINIDTTLDPLLFVHVTIFIFIHIAICGTLFIYALFSMMLTPIFTETLKGMAYIQARIVLIGATFYCLGMGLLGFYGTDVACGLYCNQIEYMSGVKYLYLITSVVTWFIGAKWLPMDKAKTIR